MRTPFSLLIVTLGCIAAPAHGSITFTWHERSVQFEDIHSSYYDWTDEPGAFHTESPDVFQSSFISPTLITGEGSTGPPGDFTMFMESRLGVIFEVDEPTPFTFSGRVESGINGGFAFTTLWAGDKPWILQIAQSGATFEWDVRGVLYPGEYELHAAAREHSLWEIQFQVPSPPGAVIMIACLVAAPRRRRM